MKPIVIVLYTLLIPPVAKLASVISFTSVDLQYYFFMTLMFLPEFSYMFSKPFRNWLRSGIEDNDGKFQKDDLNSLIIHYSTLICIRLFAIFGLRETFYQIQVRDIWVISTLSGGFGIESLGYFIRKKDKVV